MPILQSFSQTGQESDFELMQSDISSLIDANNAGPDTTLIPNSSITADKLRMVTVTNYGFYLGSVGNGGFGSSVLTIGAPLGNSASVAGFNRFVATAQADLYVSPAAVTPSTPNLGPVLLSTAVSYPRVPTNAYQVNVTTSISTGATATLDQVIWSGAVLKNSTPTVTGAANALQEYSFSVYNLTGATQTFYVVFSLQLLAPATIGGSS